MVLDVTISDVLLAPEVGSHEFCANEICAVCPACTTRAVWVDKPFEETAITPDLWDVLGFSVALI